MRWLLLHLYYKFMALVVGLQTVPAIPDSNLAAAVWKNKSTTKKDWKKKREKDICASSTEEINIDADSAGDRRFARTASTNMTVPNVGVVRRCANMDDKNSFARTAEGREFVPTEDKSIAARIAKGQEFACTKNKSINANNAKEVVYASTIIINNTAKNAEEYLFAII